VFKKEIGESVHDDEPQNSLLISGRQMIFELDWAAGGGCPHVIQALAAS
jgi:hypothetical protein